MISCLREKMVWEACCSDVAALHGHLEAPPMGWDMLLTGYVSLGIYAPQVSMWKASLPSEQLLVVRSEPFFAEPTNTLRERVGPFLGLRADQGVWSGNNLNRIGTNPGGHGFSADRELAPEDYAIMGAEYVAHPIAPAPNTTSAEVRASHLLKAFFAPFNTALYGVLDDPSFGKW